ncbi:hypothetical protein C2G38_2068240, partial [Gigaspora rosea]
MECVNCEKTTCCKHKVPWHYGQTCEKYEKNVQCPKCKITYTPVINYKCNYYTCSIISCQERFCRKKMWKKTNRLSCMLLSRRM